MDIAQGDIYWIDADEPSGSEPGDRHPFVVVQCDRFNRSAIRTVVACQLTSSLRLAGMPGNVLLEPGEGGLPRQSVVNVSQIATFNKTDLNILIGTLSAQRVRQVFEGLCLLFEPS